MRTKANLDHFVTNFGTFKVPQTVEADSKNLNKRAGNTGNKKASGFSSFASTL